MSKLTTLRLATSQRDTFSFLCFTYSLNTQQHLEARSRFHQLEMEQQEQAKGSKN